MIVELRSYRLVPTRRQEFVDHFEQRFVHTQEAVGIGVLGQFTVLGEPDRFVWLRSFPDMAARRRALGAFYGGAVWSRHGPLANEIMTRSDDVLLLRQPPTSPGLSAGYRPDPAEPPPPRRHGDGDIVVAVVTTDADRGAGVAQRLGGLRRLADGDGMLELGHLVAEPSHNDFPRLPVRDEPDAFVWLAAMRSTAGAEHVRSVLCAAAGGTATVLALAPTPRSFLPVSRDRGE